MSIHPDGTASLLKALAENPGADIRCSLTPIDPAVAVYHTPQGCAARPDDRFQALCLQHIETDGIRADSRPILDLTAEETWSKEAGLALPLRLGYSALDLQHFLQNLTQQ
jgi:hypothetical protein